MGIAMFFKSYLVGVVGNLSLGPIFIYTFGQAVRFGLRYGVLCAVAAAMVDGILFSFGLLGALSLISKVRVADVAIHFIGSIFLITMGMIALFRKVTPIQLVSESRSVPPSVIRLFTRMFLMAGLNPIAIAYFGFASTGFFENINELSCHQVVILSMFVALGTFSILSLISVCASNFKKLLSVQHQIYIQRSTAFLFFGFGIYIFYKFLGGF